MAIQTYINGTLRDDIILHTGGTLSQTGEHKTSSKVTVTLPANAELNEYDHIKFTDGSTSVFAGTIIGMDQAVLSYADWETKTYNLYITSNTDYIASVFVDLNFPAGANITQIIRGNHSGQAWYNSSLGDFYGIFERRISTEGITLGTFDDFTTIELEDSSTLWGSKVADVLDDICDAASAWWEITADKVFNMRYNNSRDFAPIVLSPSSEVFDLQPSRDAYTVYSACRVFGGKGKGEAIQAANVGVNQAVTSVSVSSVTLKYPIHAFGVWDQEFEEYMPHLILGDGSQHYVGVQGIHDNNSTYHFLYSVGSTSVSPKNGYTFLPAGGDGSVTLNYYREVDIAARLYDPDLAQEIADQRGGTGIVEYTIQDSSITTFRAAISIAFNFLKTYGRRASSVKFKTFTSGFAVGQLLRATDVDYYGITGENEITAVDATVVRQDSGTLVWLYSVEASTIPYRDKTKSIFKTYKKATFALGDNSPAATGVMIKNEIKITTTINAQAVRGQTWTELEAQYTNWTTFESVFGAWKVWDVWVKDWTYTGNYLTQIARENIAKIFAGSLSSINLNIATGIFIGAYPTPSTPLTELVEPCRIDNVIQAAYMLSDAQYLTPEAALIFVYHDSNLLMSIPTKIDKRSNSVLGDFILTLTKKDVVT